MVLTEHRGSLSPIRAVAYLGFVVYEQQVGTANLQHHVLTPNTTRLVQKLQALHTVRDVSEILPV